MVPRELMEATRETEAAIAASRTYDAAIKQHFDLAERLLVEGKVEEAEKVAKGAALLRWFAVSEVVA